jgi:hypothetical protein
LKLHHFEKNIAAQNMSTQEQSTHTTGKRQRTSEAEYETPSKKMKISSWEGDDNDDDFSLIEIPETPEHLLQGYYSPRDEPDSTYYTK